LNVCQTSTLEENGGSRQRTGEKNDVVRLRVYTSKAGMLVRGERLTKSAIGEGPDMAKKCMLQKGELRKTNVTREKKRQKVQSLAK